MVYTRVLSDIEHNFRIYGENLAVTLAKACHSPAELDDSEIIAVKAYFENRMHQIRLAVSGARIGTFQKGLGVVEDWKAISGIYVNEALSYPGGRKYIKSNPF